MAAQCALRASTLCARAMQFRVCTTDGTARCGELRTRWGTLPTPTLPVYSRNGSLVSQDNGALERLAAAHGPLALSLSLPQW